MREAQITGSATLGEAIGLQAKAGKYNRQSEYFNQQQYDLQRAKLNADKLEKELADIKKGQEDEAKTETSLATFNDKIDKFWHPERDKAYTEFKNTVSQLHLQYPNQNIRYKKEYQDALQKATTELNDLKYSTEAIKLDAAKVEADKGHDYKPTELYNAFITGNKDKFKQLNAGSYLYGAGNKAFEPIEYSDSKLVNITEGKLQRAKNQKTVTIPVPQADGTIITTTKKWEELSDDDIKSIAASDFAADVKAVNKYAEKYDALPDSEKLRYATLGVNPEFEMYYEKHKEGIKNSIGFRTTNTTNIKGKAKEDIDKLNFGSGGVSVGGYNFAFSNNRYDVEDKLKELHKKYNEENPKFQKTFEELFPSEIIDKMSDKAFMSIAPQKGKTTERIGNFKDKDGNPIDGYLIGVQRNKNGEIEYVVSDIVSATTETDKGKATTKVVSTYIIPDNNENGAAAIASTGNNDLRDLYERFEKANKTQAIGQNAGIKTSKDASTKKPATQAKQKQPRIETKGLSGIELIKARKQNKANGYTE